MPHPFIYILFSSSIYAEIRRVEFQILCAFGTGTINECAKNCRGYIPIRCAATLPRGPHAKGSDETDTGNNDGAERMSSATK